MLRMHVFLVGMAGAGKTSLGKKLAQNLDLPFIDTDQKISDIFGMSVNEIFSRMGEASFRKAETRILAWLAGQSPHIVSTGGGLCTIPANVTIMKNHGVIVHIDRPLDQILSDIKIDRRPLLAGGGRDDVIEQYNQRITHYRQAADYRLDNSKGFILGISGLTGIIKQIEKGNEK